LSFYLAAGGGGFSSATPSGWDQLRHPGVTTARTRLRRSRVPSAEAVHSGLTSDASHLAVLTVVADKLINDGQQRHARQISLRDARLNSTRTC